MVFKAGKGVVGLQTPKGVVRASRVGSIKRQSSSHLGSASLHAQDQLPKLRKTRLNAEDTHPPEFNIPGLAEFAAGVRSVICLDELCGYQCCMCLNVAEEIKHCTM